MAGLSVLTYLVASLVVGGRLLALSSRTHQLPERMIGITFVCGGTSYTVMVGSGLFGPSSVIDFLNLVAQSGLAIAGITLTVFTRTLFRPSARWAWLVIAACGASAVLTVAARVAACFGDAGALAPPGILSGYAVGLLAYGWGSLESFLAYRKGVRRLRVGFGDAAIVHRVLLWSIGAGFAFSVTLLHVACYATGRLDLPPLLVPFAMLGLVGAALTSWLAFFPPAAYQRRLGFEAQGP
jgi:hypothetical protein